MKALKILRAKINYLISGQEYEPQIKDIPTGNHGYSGQLAIVYETLIICHGYKRTHRILRKVIREWLNYAVQSPLWNQNKRRKDQDFTALVGMYKGFFSQYGIDSGYDDDTIRLAYFQLVRKLITQ